MLLENFSQTAVLAALALAWERLPCMKRIATGVDGTGKNPKKERPLGGL